jgi:hypothetical protein
MARMISVVLLLAGIGAPALGAKPAEHGDSAVPDLGCLRIRDGEKVVGLRLLDVCRYHGHPCPGSIVAFRVLRAALPVLWPDGVPQRRDLAVLCQGSMYGVLDTFALMTQGPEPPKADAILQPTRVIQQMPISRDSFTFQIIRKSTGEAVRIRVASGVYPDEFFALRTKVSAGKESPAERRRLKELQEQLIAKVCRASDGELFEPMIRSRVLMFGVR